VVTSCVSDPQGKALGPSFHFDKLLAGENLPAPLETARDQLLPVFDFVERAGLVARSSIAVASTFTTMAIDDRAIAVRDAALSHPPAMPTLTRSYPGAGASGELSPELLADYPDLAASTSGTSPAPTRASGRA